MAVGKIKNLIRAKRRRRDVCLHSSDRVFLLDRHPLVWPWKQNLLSKIFAAIFANEKANLSRRRLSQSLAKVDTSFRVPRNFTIGSTRLIGVARTRIRLIMEMKICLNKKFHTKNFFSLLSWGKRRKSSREWDEYMATNYVYAESIGLYRMYDDDCSSKYHRSGEAHEISFSSCSCCCRQPPKIFFSFSSSPPPPPPITKRKIKDHLLAFRPKTRRAGFFLPPLRCSSSLLNRGRRREFMGNNLAKKKRENGELKEFV